MNFVDAITIVFSTLGGMTLVAALAAWLGNLWANRIISTEIETLKSRLKRVENEQSIRLSKLADKQLDVMSNLYEMLADVSEDLQFYAGPFDWVRLRDDSSFKQLIDRISQLNKAYYRGKVYLPQKLDDSFFSFIEIAKRLQNIYRQITSIN